jgi:hypothetical protein
MSKQRAAIALGAAILSVAVVTFAIASGSNRAPATANPDAKPARVVCSNAGACFKADNKAYGIGFLGQAIGKNAIGMRGIAPGAPECSN